MQENRKEKLREKKKDIVNSDEDDVKASNAVMVSGSLKDTVDEVPTNT